MRTRLSLASLMAFVLLLCLMPLCFAARQPASLPQARAWLKRMSDYLGSLNSFQVHLQTSRELVFPKGGRIDVTNYGDVFVQRPNMLRVNLFQANKVRELYYNGSTLTVYSPKQNYFGIVAALPTIEQTVDMLTTDYGIDIPLADLLRPNIYNTISGRIDSGIVVGPSLLDGNYCKQLAFRSGKIDWQIWILDGPTPLPMQLVIVDHGVKGNARYEARLTNWNTTPKVTPSTFNFTPPTGAKEIPILTRGNTPKKGGR